MLVQDEVAPAAKWHGLADLDSNVFGGGADCLGGLG